MNAHIFAAFADELEKIAYGNEEHIELAQRMSSNLHLPGG